MKNREYFLMLKSSILTKLESLVLEIHILSITANSDYQFTTVKSEILQKGFNFGYICEFHSYILNISMDINI